GGGELRGVGDDARAPDRHHDQEQDGWTAVEKSYEEAAGAADRHRGRRDDRAAGAVSHDPREDTADRSASDHHERRRLGQHRRLAALRKTGADHHRRPRPHRIQLPHVSEVAEVRETKAAIIRALMTAKSEAIPTFRRQLFGPMAWIRYGEALPIVSAPISTPSATPRPSRNHVAISFMPGG